MVSVPPPRRRRFFWWALAGAALLGTSAAADLVRSDEVLRFSHENHIAMVESSRCADCHVVEESKPTPSVRAGHCRTCHDAIPRFKPRARAPRLEVALPHAAHEQKVSCATCHQAVKAPASRTDNTRAEFKNPASSQACFECHRSTRSGPRKTRCISCHQRDERRFAPDNHRRSWRWRHGQSAFLSSPSSMHGASCKECHQPSSCRACHRVEPPRDHTALWRERTHGPAAAWERTRCKTCHETGQCVGCHRTTEPRNHRGAWLSTHGLVARGRADQSCLTCHRQSYCIDCHRGGP